MTAPAGKHHGARAHRRAVAARLALLFDQHASMVLGLCRLLLRDHHEAEDAAQQTFVSAYRSLLRGTEPRDPAPWLAAIARNECRARIRRHMRSPLALEAEIGEQFPDPGDLVDQTEQRVELAALTAAIAELPTRQREAVALRDFLGLSYEEVASTLSVSVPVVESLLFRARRRLRDTVRTVPRYAAGFIALPFAVKAAVSRDGDTDGLAIAGIAGAVGAAVAAVATKVISLPFAGKAATAVTVAAVATVGPQLGGVLQNEGRQPGGNGPVAAPALSVPAEVPPAHAELPGKASGGSASKPDPQTDPEGRGSGAAGSTGAAVTGASTGTTTGTSEQPAQAGNGAQPSSRDRDRDRDERADEEPAAEPDPTRAVVTTAEPETPADAAPPAESEPAPPADSEPAPPAEEPALPIGPDGLPIIGLDQVEDPSNGVAAPEGATDPQSGQAQLPTVGPEQSSANAAPPQG